MDYSPLSSSVHGIFHLRILEWVAVSFSREYSQPRDWPHVPCVDRQVLYQLSHKGRLYVHVLYSVIINQSNRLVIQILTWPQDWILENIRVTLSLNSLGTRLILDSIISKGTKRCVGMWVYVWERAREREMRHLALTRVIHYHVVKAILGQEGKWIKWGIKFESQGSRSINGSN